MRFFISSNANSKQLWKELKSLNITKNNKADLTEQFNNVKDMNNYFVNCIPLKTI